MNRHEYRVQIIFVLYKHLLLQKDLEACFVDTFESDEDPFLLTMKSDLIANEDKYIEEISKHLRKWSFNRLNYVDQAILLESTSELKQGLNDKNITIDEAIKIAKKYSDDDAYKYINGVLDNL